MRPKEHLAIQRRKEKYRLIEAAYKKYGGFHFWKRFRNDIRKRRAAFQTRGKHGLKRPRK